MRTGLADEATCTPAFSAVHLRLQVNREGSSLVMRGDHRLAHAHEPLT
jgi:hypothetical protein